MIILPILITSMVYFTTAVPHRQTKHIPFGYKYGKENILFLQTLQRHHAVKKYLKVNIFPIILAEEPELDRIIEYLESVRPKGRSLIDLILKFSSNQTRLLWIQNSRRILRKVPHSLSRISWLNSPLDCC